MKDLVRLTNTIAFSYTGEGRLQGRSIQVNFLVSFSNHISAEARDIVTYTINSLCFSFNNKYIATLHEIRPAAAEEYEGIAFVTLDSATLARAFFDEAAEAMKLVCKDAILEEVQVQWNHNLTSIYKR